MRPTTTSSLRVPGANLYYEVRGSGPTLLLICGGVYDAAAFAGIAERLADRWTVVTYDRRGNSRSPLDGPREPQRIEVHGDDAHRVLEAVGVDGDERADVFGNSSGAIIGMELAARHPEHVRTLVAHEPPLFELLEERDRWREVVGQIERAFAEGGAGPAGEVLGTAYAAAVERDGDAEPQATDQRERIPGGEAAPSGEPDPETLEMLARFERNTEFFIGYEVPPFARYVPDLVALGASPVRMVAGVGETSRGEPAHRAALAVAERLGSPPAVFPGDHGGFGTDPDGFAKRLAEVLSGA
jgi:pimeloyl-ACP methyl ester carboxylesterase